MREMHSTSQTGIVYDLYELRLLRVQLYLNLD